MGSTWSPLERRATEDVVPLLPTQMSWWNYVARNWHRTSRACSLAVRISGALNVSFMEAVIQEVVRRHEALRTRIVAFNGTALKQEVDPPGSRRLRVIHIVASNASETEAALAVAVQQFVDERIDIAQGPLFDARLFSVSPQEHVLVVMIEHSVADLASCAILAEEVWTLYESGTAGRSIERPAPPIQFPDYAVWQDKNYDLWVATHGEYWKRRLAGASPTIVPCSDVLLAGEARVGGLLRVPLGIEASEGMRVLARRYRVQLAIVVLAAYVAVISRWCEKKDVLVRFPVTGRHRAELRDMIGFLASSLFLRIQIRDGETFEELLADVGHEYRSAYIHADHGQLHRMFPELNSEVWFNWIPPADAVDTRAASAVTTLRLDPFPIRFAWPLKFHAMFEVTGRGVEMVLHYSPAMFSAGTVEEFAQRLKRFAVLMLVRPEDTLDTIAMDAEEPSLMDEAI